MPSIIQKLHKDTSVWRTYSIAVVILLCLFSARGGFGFDACEYFIGAEDWLDGRRPYKDFFFTKTPGILFLTAALFRWISNGGGAIAVYVILINMAWAAAAAWAVVPLMGSKLARWVFPISLAAGLCCMINFWNTEQPLTLLVALAAGLELRNTDGRRSWTGWLAGLLLGFAVLFKLFAVLAVGSLIALIACRTGRPWAQRALEASRLIGGFAIVIAAVFLWARSAGIDSEMLRQSVLTPLFDYASHTKYLADFLRRAGWFILPAAVGMVWSVWRGWSRRPAGFREPGFILGILGLPFLLPLLKNQAAHYAVPFLPFAAAWAIWMANEALELKPDPRRLSTWVAAAIFAITFVAVIAYKQQSLKRIFSKNPAIQQQLVCSELARWVGGDERVIFINAGPYPHVALYWMMGERSYPWPFYTISGFSRRAIEEFGFEKFYAVCADPRTRILGVSLDGPMEETLPWVFSDAQLEKLGALIKRDYVPHPLYPRVYLRKGSVPVNAKFRRGPYAGKSCQKENSEAR